MAAPALTYRPSPRIASIALFLALISSAAMVYHHLGLFMPALLRSRAAIGLGNGYSFGNDFYPVWLAAQRWLRDGQNPYSDAMTREIQHGLYGRTLDDRRPTDPKDQRMLAHPAFTLLLFWPATLLPFAVVRAVLLVVLTAMTFATVVLWTRVLAWNLPPAWIAVIALLTLSSYQALEGLFAVQLGLLVGFLLAASIRAVQKRRFALAGVLMAIATIKPQVCALAILYLLLWSAHDWRTHDWRTRRRFSIGFFSTFAVLTGASLALLPNWIFSWVHTLVAYHRYMFPTLVGHILTTLLGPPIVGPATSVITAAAIFFAVALAWRNRAVSADSFQFQLAVSVLLAITTIAFLPGQGVYDHLILLPGILLLVRYRNQLRRLGGSQRILVAVGALVLFWPWATAIALALVQPLVPARHFFSPAIFQLPLRTAGSLPFAVLALLIYAMRINPQPNRESA